MGSPNSDYLSMEKHIGCKGMARELAGKGQSEGVRGKGAKRGGCGKGQSDGARGKGAKRGSSRERAKHVGREGMAERGRGVDRQSELSRAGGRAKHVATRGWRREVLGGRRAKRLCWEGMGEGQVLGGWRGGSILYETIGRLYPVDHIPDLNIAASRWAGERASPDGGGRGEGVFYENVDRLM